VFFFAGDHEAGAHGSGDLLAADAGPVAHFDGPVKALFGAEVDDGFEGDGLVALAVAEVFGDGGSVDDVAGVEQIFGVEDAFDLPVEVVEVGAEEAFVGPTANPAPTR
jgi:hypothetical protein